MNPARMVHDLTVWAIPDGILTPWPSWPLFRQVMPGERDHGQKSRISIHQCTVL